MKKEIKKDWYKSRTIWFNVLSSLVSLAIALQAFPLPEVGMTILVGIITIGNMILRFDTDKGIR